MTWDEFKRLTMPLAVQLGAEWDSPTWKLYHRTVEKVPLLLYERAITKAAADRSKMPSAAQMLGYAEACRKELLELHPYEPCDKCNHLGTVKVKSQELGSGHKVPKYERCSCYGRWERQIEQMGATLQPLALPPAEREFTQVSE